MKTKNNVGEMLATRSTPIATSGKRTHSQLCYNTEEAALLTARERKVFVMLLSACSQYLGFDSLSFFFKKKGILIWQLCFPLFQGDFCTIIYIKQDKAHLCSLEL